MLDGTAEALGLEGRSEAVIFTAIFDRSCAGRNSDLEDIDFTQAVVTATVANTIPVGMELTDDNVRILDAAGNKIDGITVSVAQGNIQAGDGSETPVSSELEIKLETTETGTLSRLTAIDLKITATTGSTQGIQLYSNQWVQLQNARLRIPKGVIIDLN